MSSALPDRVEIARQAQARRIYEGALPLAGMRRLAESLADVAGEARYTVAFGIDELGVQYLDLVVEAGLPLVCQRTLERFVLPVEVRERLGAITSEAAEAGLPEGYEPLLAPDGTVSIGEVIEDELILALPVVPVKPGAPLEWTDPSDEGAAEEARENPFAALGALKKH
ncbi:MAG: DUF177 domain-containing protein [Xanthomonadales bacterium]|nr:DUF177 domain-containing protein [Xanthomonadales bacterium]